MATSDREAIPGIIRDAREDLQGLMRAAAAARVCDNRRNNRRGKAVSTRLNMQMTTSTSTRRPMTFLGIGKLLIVSP